MVVAAALYVWALALSGAVAAQGAPVTFGNGKAAFAPPPGFKTLTAAERQQLLPTADPRMTVIGDSTNGSTIGFALIEVKVARAQLDMFRKYLTETYTKAISLKWVANKLEPVGGRDGIRMEFDDDRQMRHVSLVGYVDDGHAVMMMYNVPTKTWTKLEPAVRASIASLRITP